jgi:hypothetical protein
MEEPNNEFETVGGDLSETQQVEPRRLWHAPSLQLLNVDATAGSIVPSSAEHSFGAQVS